MWFILSLLFAIWSAISTYIIKRLSVDFDPIPLLLTFFLFYLPCTFIVMMLTGGIPHASHFFFIYMFISAIIDSVAFIFAYKAISISPISLTSPIQSFGPIITTIIAISALGESVSEVKFMGILLIVFGVYLLNISDIKGGLIAPIQNLVSNKGVRFIFLSTVLWSITPIFQKKALHEISPQIPLFASFTGIVFVTIILTPIAIKRVLSYRKKISMKLKWFILVGIGGAFAQFAAYKAFSLTNVGFASAVFKTSSFFVILLGGILLKEKRIRERLLASAVMLAGILLLIT